MTNVLAPWVVVIRIVEASCVVVCCARVLVTTKVLASRVIVTKIVDAGSVLPGAVETKVSVLVSPA